MDTGKKLSIVLVTRNSKSVLFDCLKALDNNDEITSSKNSQWIIVDNDSTDGSIEEVLNLYPQTQVIKNKENLGFAKAANQGFNVSETDFILYINTDTEIKKNSISKLYDKIISDKSIAVIGPRLLRKNNTIQKSVYPEATLYTEIFKPIVKLCVSIKENFYKTGKCYTVNSLRGAKKSLSKYVGGIIHEELVVDGKVGKLNNVFYHYGGLGSDDKMTFNKKKMYNESLLKYFDKNRNKFENFIIRMMIKNK